MGTMVKFNAANIDDLGLVDNIPEDQLDMLADQIETVEQLLPIVKGDMYLAKCKALGVSPFKHSESPELGLFIKKLGRPVKTIQNYANVAKSWPRNERFAGLRMSHYDNAMDVPRSVALSILEKAQIGIRKPDGTWDKPRKAVWVQRECDKYNGGPKADLLNAVDDATDAIIDSVMPDVSKVINNSDLPAKQKTELNGKIKRAIAKEVKKLETGFTEAVDTQVATMLEPEKQKMERLRKHYAEEKKWYKKLREGVALTITEKEFKSLRQFCHPDRHQDKPVVADRVYGIVEKIGDKLGFVK